MVKNLPVTMQEIQETWVQSLGPSTRSPRKRSGNSLQYSCLGNPMDRGAWWLPYGVTKQPDMTEQLKNNKGEEAIGNGLKRPCPDISYGL